MAATSFIPAVLNALVELATEKLDTSVSDGYRVGETDSDDELMIGVDDAVSQDRADAAQSTQEWAYTGGTMRDERGTITCVVIAYNGAADMAAARNRAWQIVDDLFNAITQDATLGVPGLQWVRPGDDITFLQDQDRDGAVAAIVFRVAFYGQVP